MEVKGRWVTMNGAKVFINDKGDVIMGLGKEKGGGKSHAYKFVSDERIDKQLRKYLLDLPDSCTVIPTKNPKTVVVKGAGFTSIYQIEPHVEALCFKYDLEYKHNRSSGGWDVTIK